MHQNIQHIFEMAQVSNEQRVFFVETYFRTNIYKKVKEAFSDKIPEIAVPSKSTLERNVKIHRNYGTSLNRNKETSGTSAQTGENIEAQSQSLCQRQPSFHKIIV